MKKLICALVLLAMLVPVAAMADLLPELTTPEHFAAVRPQVGSEMNNVRYHADWNDSANQARYTANYFLTGALDRIVANFDSCHCMVVFRPNGVISVGDSHFHPSCNLEHVSPINPISLKSDNEPEENAMDIAKAYGWTDTDGEFSDFIAALEEAYRDTEVNSWGAGEESRLEKATDERFIVSFRNKENGPEKKFVHFGPIVYRPGTDAELRVYGDEHKNILSWADYHVDNGELNEYGMFAQDGTTLTVYDYKNRLQSTEIWVDDGYWIYKNERWAFSATGDPEDGEFMDPTEEVLRKITLAPREANFGVNDAASLSAVKTDDIGTPVVIGNVGKAVSVKATMDDYNKSTYEMSVNGGELGTTIEFLLPYGAGQNQKIAEQFTYTIEHEYEDGKFIKYSTEPNGDALLKAEFTAKGVLISGVESFSPFTVTWGDKQAVTASGDASVLPSTGDSSNLLAYACLLMVSAAALYMLGKRRAHQ